MENNDIVNMSEIEKNILYPSLITLNANIANFSKLFYKYFQNTSANELFEGINIEEQVKKFEASFKIILYNFQHPINLREHLDLVVSRHVDYGIMPENIESFVVSFIRATKDILGDSANNDVINLWSKLINQIMLYFKSRIY